MRSVPLVANDSNIDLNKRAAIISIKGHGLIRMKTSLMMVHLQSQAANQQLVFTSISAYNTIILKDSQKIKTQKQVNC